MKKTRSDCPISCALDLLGDKWTLLILRDIMLRGKASFSDFLASEEKIATNILTTRLHRLETEQIVTRKVAPNNKSKFLYQLTAKGIDLLPLLIELMDWGAKYHAHCPRMALGRKIQKDKAGVIAAYREELNKQLTPPAAGTR